MSKNVYKDSVNLYVLVSDFHVPQHVRYSVGDVICSCLLLC